MRSCVAWGGFGDGSKKERFWEKLIINQSCEYKRKKDTTAHMAKLWTNQLMADAQTEQMGLLPRTTGIHVKPNEGSRSVKGQAWEAMLGFFYQHLNPLITSLISQSEHIVRKENNEKCFSESAL